MPRYGEPLHLFVEVPGFEPGQAEPKSAVLAITPYLNSSCKDKDIFINLLKANNHYGRRKSNILDERGKQDLAP